MSLSILHVLESIIPDAGSVAVCLSGLHETLASRGLQSQSFAPPADVMGVLDGADIVHIHGWDYEPAHRIAASALKAGRPYVISPHGCLTYGPHNKPTWKGRVLFALGGRRLVRGAVCITAINRQEEHDLQSRRVHPRVRMLPYGLCFKEYADTPAAGGIPANESRCLLMLGPLHPRGGCVALLKAIAEIGPDANGWNVVLAGKDSGEWRKLLASAVHRKKSDERVSFADASTMTQQRALLSNASLVASPGLHVGLPVSIMQAVASGVPAIASTCTAPPNLNGAIQVCEPRREELRNALRSVLRLPDESRRAMGEEARSVGRAAFDWSVLADQYVQLYKNVA